MCILPLFPEYNQNETVSVVSTKKFLKEIRVSLGKTRISSTYPALSIIASDWQLNLSNATNFKVARRILENSIANN